MSTRPPRRSGTPRPAPRGPAGPDEIIERFLATGAVPRGFRGWPGELPARRLAAATRLREILAHIVSARARGAPLRLGPPPVDTAERVRGRVGPAVLGLFDPPDAAPILDHLPARVRVVTAASFPAAVASLPLDRAWDLANLVLDQLGAPTLADDVPRLEGLSCGTTAYVLPAALRPAADADVVLHECVHVLLAARRRDFGLDRGRTPLLAVPATAHETVAYAVEAWGCAERAGARDATPWTEAAAQDARVDRGALDHLLRAARAEGWNGLRAGIAALR